MSAPRPRVSEHTDAARLEALRDSMRPRVEGEAVEMDPPICVCGDHFNEDSLCYACRRDTELQLQDAELRLAALTAEVARLRGLVRRHANAAERMGLLWIAKNLRADLALPTNAQPEVPNDES